MNFHITLQRDPTDLMMNRQGRVFGFVSVVDGKAIPGTRNVCYEVFVGGRCCW